MKLSSSSVPVEDRGDLLDALPVSGGIAWLRNGDGFIASGEVARIDVGTGPARFARAAEQLQANFEAMESDDRVGVPGSGPVAFGAITFDPDVEGSVLIVPKLVMARRDGTTWRTLVGDLPDGPADSEGGGEPDRIRYWGPSVSEMAWLEAVAKAEAAVRRGDLEKVVLARDVRVWSKSPLRPRRLLRRLVEGSFPEVAVLTFTELDSDLQIRPVGRLVPAR